MAEDLATKEVQRCTLRVLKEATEGLTRGTIIRKVESVCNKKYGTKCPLLPKLIGSALLFFKRNGFIILDNTGRYMLQERWMKYAKDLDKQTAEDNAPPQSKSMEALHNIRHNCHITTQEKRSRDLDPNKSVKCHSQDSLSGDEIERTRKRLRTNTKRLERKEMPTELPNPHKFGFNAQDSLAPIIKTEHEHVCFLPEDGLKDFETLTVLHPESYEFCGRMVFLPTKLQNPPCISEFDKNLIKKKFQSETQIDNETNLTKANSNTHDGIQDPNSDELKPPAYINSHYHILENVEKSPKRILKRTHSNKVKRAKSKRFKCLASDERM